ncbi:endonuclease/exonuclease/phosphatase family protein [Thalassotalea castellviae]|uniref:Endonuclease/exonuclease/phosphatase family protein n=1 Tax=Thalassotalea castellviae TaxID=3075612 RepID=A0ABU2ZWK6_9GAMM|nr:endonuclease/exonuclease/phosphatase family protein [Thalassotalea sp. W431]MDT0602318.1 endonuclease/exonuclease/phosphatase family protein [Thalassotalea sp. W431]
MLPPKISHSQLKIATFNLFNYLEPPNAYYEFERIYSLEQWQKKQHWIANYLNEYQPDIIGFQEVFSIESLKALVEKQGYNHFAVVDEPHIEDDFIYSKPVVAIASKFAIIQTNSVKVNNELASLIGLSDEFSFTRQLLRATIDIPHLGHTDCYVVHFKSKRSMIEYDEQNANQSAEKTIIETLKAQVVGGWGSTVQRGSEATLLMAEIISRREQTQYPIILLGDFNHPLDDGVLNQLLTNTLRFASTSDCDKYLAKYCLQDAWQLSQKVALNNTTYANKNHEKLDGNTLLVSNSREANQQKTAERIPTHYFAGKGSVLDYILLSCEFDASNHNSLYQVSNHQTYDKHLINPIFDYDGESTDHGIVLVTLTLRS